MVKDGKKEAERKQQESGWRYVSGGTAEDFASSSETDGGRRDDAAGAVEWTASEFVAHEKGPGWFAVFGLVALLFSMGLYFITRDRFTAAAVVVMSIILGIAAARKPKVVAYRLDGSGLTAGKKFYPYREFKSFAMPEDGPFASIVLVPMKRFGFSAGAFLAPDSQKEAMKILSSHLPLERGEPNLVDEIMRSLRF